MRDLEPIIEAVEVVTDRMTDLAGEKLPFTSRLRDLLKGGAKSRAFWKLSRVCRYLQSEVDKELIINSL
jgi:hypothetical protein